MKRRLALSPPLELVGYPLFIDDEWEVVDGRTDVGRGDLVIASEDGTCFAMASSSSSVASVHQQSQRYATAWRSAYEARSVVAFVQVGDVFSSAQEVP